MKVILNFDFDDNILFMDTRIHYFHKRTGEKLKISTGTYAKTRMYVGEKSYKLFVKKTDDGLVEMRNQSKNTFVVDVKNYEIIYENEKSFIEFRSEPNTNFFLRDVKLSLSKKKFGPSWEDFQYYCSKKKYAENVNIITARGHSPEEIHEGLMYMKEQGFIKHVPPVYNLYPVTFPKIKEEYNTDDVTYLKRFILKKLIKSVDEEKITITFSDDDWKTYTSLVKYLKQYKHHWKNVEFIIFYTGEEPEKIVL